jgi:predicted enzyme related to lactoylglutathione lyase
MSQAQVWYPGRFVWHEIITPDIAATKLFYGELCGWSYEDFDLPGGPAGAKYPMIKAAGSFQGGMMASQSLPMKDVPPNWMAYVTVRDVDAAAATARAAGGAIYAEPFDIPGVGRMAVLADPAGAAISAFRSSTGDPPEVERPGLGTFCWDQLNTSDAAGAKAFYAKVFGWTTKDFAGGGGVEVFEREGNKEAASFMQAPPGVRSHWLTYILVDSLSGANARAAKLGGKVLMEKIPVPGLGAFSVISDNVGAIVGLFEAAPR